METLLGRVLKNPDNSDFDTANLNEPKLICLYFSGSFCGPCKNFTKYLEMFYEEINCDGYNLEVVLVPADSNESSFTGEINQNTSKICLGKVCPSTTPKSKVSPPNLAIGGV